MPVRSAAFMNFCMSRAAGGGVLAAAPYTEVASLLPPEPPTDPVERVTLVATELMRVTIEAETELRAMLSFSLDPSRAAQALPLRTGKRIIWFDDALAPLREELGDQAYRKLVLRVAASVGIEALVWLTDIAGLTRRDAADLLIGTAASLTRAALEPPSAQTERGG
jgi:hypothetical protein